jgi:hypothetical protein
MVRNQSEKDLPKAACIGQVCEQAAGQFASGVPLPAKLNSKAPLLVDPPYKQASIGRNHRTTDPDVCLICQIGGQH